MSSIGEGAEFTANVCNEIHPLPSTKKFFLKKGKFKKKKRKKNLEICSSAFSSTFEGDNNFSVPKYNTAMFFQSKTIKFLSL